MMRKSLLVLGLVATVGFLLAGWRGYQGSDNQSALQQHLYWAMGAGLLALLSHCAIAIYLVGTARVLRLTAREYSLGATFEKDGRRNVRRAVPAALLAIATLVLTVVAGAGLLARLAPHWAHDALIYAAFATQILALIQEARALASQDLLILDLDRRVGS